MIPPASGCIQRARERAAVRARAHPHVNAPKVLMTGLARTRLRHALSIYASEMERDNKAARGNSKS